MSIEAFPKPVEANEKAEKVEVAPELVDAVNEIYEGLIDTEVKKAGNEPKLGGEKIVFGHNSDGLNPSKQG